jgi:dethiobiotin synthase
MDLGVLYHYVDAMQGYFITGTDTDVGKTVASAWVMLHLGADYWKPIQSGTEPTTDLDVIRKLTKLPDERFYPETYTLSQPLSPHEAARRDGVKIEMNKFQLPQTVRPLVVEGAGGLMVPINEDNFVIDLIKQLDLPVILVCRSGLGTINHTLMSLEVMRTRNISVVGIIMSGVKSPHNRQALEEYGDAPIIAEIDFIENITPEALLAIKPEIDFGTIGVAV